MYVIAVGLGQPVASLQNSDETLAADKYDPEGII